MDAHGAVQPSFQGYYDAEAHIKSFIWPGVKDVSRIFYTVKFTEWLVFLKALNTMKTSYKARALIITRCSNFCLR